jgi:hypothetical protein
MVEQVRVLEVRILSKLLMYMGRNKDQENRKRRKRYACLKEAAGQAVRKYTPRQEALRAKQREKERAIGVERAVDSPEAR